MDSKQAAAIVTACVNEKSADALQKLTESECLAAVSACREELSRESSLLELDGGITVTGLVRGEFDSLLQILEAAGPLGKAQILFLGNYTAQSASGNESLECLLLLILLKVAYPSHTWLLRGQCEDVALSRIYTSLFNQVKAKYGVKMMLEIGRGVFEWLPVAAVVGSKVFCVSGGIAPHESFPGDGNLLAAITTLKRPCVIPDEGLVCDLVFSGYVEGVRGWVKRDEYPSSDYGGDALEHFLAETSMDAVITTGVGPESTLEVNAAGKLWCVVGATSRELDQLRESKGCLIWIDSEGGIQTRRT